MIDVNTLYGEGNNRVKTYTNLQSNLTEYVKFSIRIGPTWELGSKPSHSESSPVPSIGTYIISWEMMVKTSVLSGS